MRNCSLVLTSAINFKHILCLLEIWNMLLFTCASLVISLRTKGERSKREVSHRSFFLFSVDFLAFEDLHCFHLSQIDNFCFSFFIFNIVIFSLWKLSVCFTFCVTAVLRYRKKKSPNEGDGLSVVRKFSAISQLPVKISPLSVTSKCYSYRLIKRRPDFQKTPASCEASITSVRIGLIN